MASASSGKKTLSRRGLYFQMLNLHLIWFHFFVTLIFYYIQVLHSDAQILLCCQCLCVATTLYHLQIAFTSLLVFRQMKTLRKPVPNSP